jgi:hypothetical protein
MKVIAELDAADAVTVGMSLRALAHTSLADASAAERLERVGKILVAAKPPTPPEHDSWRMSALSAIAELEAKIAAQGPLVAAALATERAREAVVACEQVWASSAHTGREHDEAGRRLANARFWHSTCTSEEHQAAERLAMLSESTDAG